MSRLCKVSCSSEALAAVSMTGLHNCRFYTIKATVSCADRFTGGPMKPVTGLELPHCVTVARQNYSAMAACNAAKHAAPCSRYEHRIVLMLLLYVHASSLN